jgi:hypothetical protein
MSRLDGVVARSCVFVAIGAGRRVGSPRLLQLLEEAAMTSTHRLFLRGLGGVVGAVVVSWLLRGYGREKVKRWLALGWSRHEGRDCG